MKSWKLIGLLLMLSTLLGGCGGWGDDNESPPPPVAVVDALDSPTEGVLSTSGAVANAPNPTALTMRWALSGASFGDEVAITVNDQNVAPASITKGATEITAQVTLEEGRNTVKFKSYDKDGRPLFNEQVLWGGTRTLSVRLVDAQGQTFTQQTDISLKLADDETVGFSTTATGGLATFEHLPARTVIVQARADGNLVGVAGGVGSDGVITVSILGLSAASTVSNNDFSQGLLGWTVPATAASVVPHEENVGPALAAPLKAGSRPMASRVVGTARKVQQALAAKSTLAADQDADLSLTTVGEGAQSVSRTFPVASGSTAVVVRYRFITSEVPGGYFGSQYNDYFSVNIRSKAKGLVASEVNTMNGLGLAAFDANGSTAWRTVKIATDPQSDEVQVDVRVANVADGALDSSVIIDYVAEKKDQVIPTLAWDPTNGGLLLRYKVQSGPLTEPVTIGVHWASGTTSASAIGDAMFSVTVPAGTADGNGPATPVKGAFLSDDPAGVTHIIAFSSATAVSSVRDAKIDFGANANAAVVPESMRDIVRDSMRAAGVANATISSTARTPADQARAMFANLVNPENTMAVNIQTLLALYAPPGDAVVNVFASQSAGQTLSQVVANATAIRAAMEAEVIAQGPENVSKHCADPTKRSTIDVGVTPFSAVPSATAFKTTASARVDKFIDEISNNHAFHLELALE